jgi:threonine/homoserine/homoserine lactone efflux protein
MGTAIGDILPLAIGVAISPIPIIAIILMLFSTRAKSNGSAFVLGWMLGMAVVGGIVLAIGTTANLSSGRESQTISSILRLALGLLLIAVAVRNWQKRPKPGEEPQLPKWMAGLDTFTPAKALGLGGLLSGLNPKNLAFVLSASLVIGQAGLSTGQTILVFAIFVVIASLTVAGPALFYLVGGSKAAKTLQSMKVWLAANNATVMAVLCLVLGVVVLGKGISGLSG